MLFLAKLRSVARAPWNAILALAAISATTEVIILNLGQKHNHAKEVSHLLYNNGMAKQTFPKDFLWGASTAAHQVEGNNHNQWSEWEKANADRLAARAEKRYGWIPSWPRIKDQAVKPDNYISGRAVEHYQRYKEDFTILKQLNMNAFRFSIEWSRIEPEEGVWDEKEIEHYRKYIMELRRLDIEPVVTLWHWTEPIWFAKKGGFEHAENVHYFERFAAKVAEELGDLFTYVLTLNEPNNYVLIGYMLGIWPPSRKNPILGLRVHYNLVKAHRAAYQALKAIRQDFAISACPQLSLILPISKTNPLNRWMTTLQSYGINWWFLNRIRNQLDFIGLNYYRTEYINLLGAIRTPKEPVNDLGWFMRPSDLSFMIQETWQRYRKPIIITENGLADARDEYRRWWLEQTLEALRGALQQGIDLRGYLHWSLLDNFEWADGWCQQFGLVAVDRTTMKRTIRPSAQWFAHEIERASKIG